MGFDRTRRQQEQEEEALQLVVRGVWRQIRMESTKQDSGGTNEEEAKVFRAHAVPQGLCGKLTNAPRLLANQRNGDCPIQKKACAKKVGIVQRTV